MVAFWAMRSKICGEQAFLPLVATGHGALSTEAIGLLNSGYVVRLLDDKEGRTVLFIDRSRFQIGGVFRNAILQLILYMLCMIVEEEESSQKKGFVLVVNGKVRRCLLLDYHTVLLFAQYFGTLLHHACLSDLSRSLYMTTRISNLPNLTASYHGLF
jgi:hypothetical protein